MIDERSAREPDDLPAEDVVTACACGHAPGEHNACGECRAAVFHPKSSSKSLRVLVACEFSGVVRDAFRALGHDAISCDILPTETPGPHIKGDVREALIPGRWDVMVAHPPCTHLAVSGARWFKNKLDEQAAALDFVRLLLDAPVPHIAVENPIGVISSRIRKPDQIIQPWQHGHGETKATCLWLKNLPLLTPSHVVSGREGRVWKEPPSPDRWKARSRTLPGIAEAMAVQWGAHSAAVFHPDATPAQRATPCPCRRYEP
jgi:hypothetical protein